LIIVIGLALLAFILGDAWKIIRPNQGMVMVGKIDGKSISALDYQNEIEKYSEIVKFSMGVTSLTDDQFTAVKDEVWNNMVRKSLLEKETSALGLKVTDAEVQAIIENGQSSILSQTPFTNPETGQFDADYLRSFLASYAEIDRASLPAEYMEYYDNMYNFWLYIEDNIRTNTLYSKYLALVEESALTNPVSLKNSYENRMRRADVLLAAIPFTSVPDSTVTVTTGDIKKAYNERKEIFRQYAESRDIQYIDVLIEPSNSDREEVLAEVAGFANQLEETTEDYAAFIRLTESVYPYSEVPATRRGLPQDVVIRLDSVSQGHVYGPYYNAADDSYNAFKVLSQTQGFDSICIRRIQVVAEDEASRNLRADSIYKALRAGADFEETALAYSQSGQQEWLASSMYETSILSGNDAVYLNTINGMKKGELVNLKLDGATLIIKVDDLREPVSKYNVAIIKRYNYFSDETSNAAYNKFSQFMASNSSLDSLKANAEAAGYRLMTLNDFQSFSYNIADVPKSHDALRWVFEAKEGEVSNIFEAGEQSEHLLVVALDKIHEAGYRTAQDMTNALMPIVLNEKKAETMVKDMASAGTMDELRKINGVQVDTVQFVNFTTPAYVSMTFSNEPLLGAAVYDLEQGEMSAPIKGNGGVFVAQKLTSDTYSLEFDPETEADRIKSVATRNIAADLLQELFFKAKVEDNRYKTF